MSGLARSTERKPCAVEGCDRPSYGRGWCAKHYQNWKRNGDPVSTFNDPARRFAAAVEDGPVPEFAPDLGPCLLYTGATNTSRYGQFRYDGRNGYAHRYAWESQRGRIPDGMTIDHLCRVRTCVRLDHLELVTGPENTRRGARARRSTTCKRGHPRNPDQLGRCMECSRLTGRASDQRRARSRQGLPDRRVRLDQAALSAAIAEACGRKDSVAAIAARYGINKKYLGKRAWLATKETVRARDGACVACGAGGDLDVHHRQSRGMGGTSLPGRAYAPENLLAVCRECHDYIEAHPAWARTKGYRVDRADDPRTVPVIVLVAPGVEAVFLLDQDRRVPVPLAA